MLCYDCWSLPNCYRFVTGELKIKDCKKNTHALFLATIGEMQLRANQLEATETNGLKEEIMLSAAAAAASTCIMTAWHPLSDDFVCGAFSCSSAQDRIVFRPLSVCLSVCLSRPRDLYIMDGVNTPRGRIGISLAECDKLAITLKSLLLRLLVTITVAVTTAL